MAIWQRRPDDPGNLIHHSDRGVQYLAIRYTERLAEAEAVSPVGFRGDSYDNALAETVNGLYKAGLINRHGPWRSVEAVELATADWVHFWNTKRLHGARGDIPPAEFEAAYHSAQAATAAVQGFAASAARRRRGARYARARRPVTGSLSLAAWRRLERRIRCDG